MNLDMYQKEIEKIDLKLKILEAASNYFRLYDQPSPHQDFTNGAEAGVEILKGEICRIINQMVWDNGDQFKTMCFIRDMIKEIKV